MTITVDNPLKDIVEIFFYRGIILQSFSLVLYFYGNTIGAV